MAETGKSSSLKATFKFLRGAVVTLLLVAAVFGARYALGPWLEGRAPFSFFYVPIIAAAWLGGWLAGLSITVLCAALGFYFFLSPGASLEVQFTADAGVLAIFLAEAAVITLLVDRLSYSSRRAKDLVSAERDAREQEERTKNLLELTTNHVPTSIAYLDRQQNFVFANSTFDQWFGKKPREVVGRSLAEVLPPQQLKERASYIEAALAGRKVSFDALCQTSLGKNRYHTITYTPDVTPAGQVRGFVAMEQDVTEAKEREARLAWSEERFRQLVDNLPSHVFYVKERDPHRVIYVSPAYEKLWGATASSLYANPLGLLNSVHPDDRAKLLAASEAEGRGQGSTVEYRLVQPDGSVRWILDRSFPIYNQAGEAYRTAGIAADVTERKLAELEKQKLLDAERRARELANMHRAKLYALFMQAPGAVSIATGPELRYELANETYTRMTGKGELVGRTVAEVYEGLDPKIMEIIQRVAFNGERFTSDEIQIELDWQNDGHVYPRFFNLLYEPVFSPEGRPDGIMSFSYEITQQVVARKLLEASQDALKESEQNFRNLAEAVPHMVWTAEPDGRPSFFNRRWADYTGVAPQEGFGGDWSRFLHREDVAQMGTRWKKSLRTGVPMEQEARLLRKDGVYRWHLIRATAVREDSGKLVRWYGTVTDIQDLHEAMNARDRLLSICSHELKTPVTSLKLQNQLVRRAIEKKDPTAFDPSRITNLVERADTQLDRLSRLIEEMLDFSRISQGKFSISPARGDLSQTVRDAVERMRPLFQAKSVPLKVDVEDGIEASFDSLRVEQVVSNLLDNALKYGDGKPVALEVAKGANQVSMRVVDGGAGIAPEYQDRIFEPYERALSHDNSITGLGMGLYITRQILNAHGGSVSVQSAPSKGAEFRVNFPLSGRPGPEIRPS